MVKCHLLSYNWINIYKKDKEEAPWLPVGLELTYFGDERLNCRGRFWNLHSFVASINSLLVKIGLQLAGLI